MSPAAKHSERSRRHDLTSVVRQAAPPETETRADAADRIRKLAYHCGLEDKASEALTALADLPAINILTDLPAESDAFGFAPFVRTLCDIALSESTQTPLAVALDGEWGSGKTSVMKMVERQARLVGFPCIWLNAWSLESAENLIASVGAGIQEEIRTLEITKGSIVTRVLKELPSLLGKALLNMTGASGAVVTDFLRTAKERDEGAAQLASVVTARQSFHELVEVLLKAAAVKEQQEASQKKREPKPDRGLRLMVFIDDIDRALPDQIATTLKTLKLVLENPRCVFLLGMDMEIVARAVESYYRGHSHRIVVAEEPMARFPSERPAAPPPPEQEAVPPDFGRSYLEKLVQIHVKLPQLTRDVALRYVDDLQLVPEVMQLIRWAPDADTLNPRRLKRYINWLSIALQLIVGSHLPEGITNLMALRFLALRRNYPEIYQALVQGGAVRYADLDQSFLPRHRVAPTRREEVVSEFHRFCAEVYSERPLQEFEAFLPTAPLLSSVTDRQFLPIPADSAATNA